MGDILDRRSFCRVAEMSSFAAAARDLGLPTASVSASVKRLEETLGVRLLERTTRKVSLTDAGRAYYDRVLPIIDDLLDAEALTSSVVAEASGRVRVAAPTHLAEAILVPRLPNFACAHPNIVLDFALADRPADMVGESVDIALRIGPLADSAMTAMKLGAFRQTVCASPDWILRNDGIEHPSDLSTHLATAYRFPGSAKGYPWVFKKDGCVEEHSPTANILFDDLDAYIASGCTGLGPVCALSFQLKRHIEQGSLIKMLQDWDGVEIDVHAVMAERRLRSRRVELVLEWIKSSVSQAADALK